ncbi:hypothetical protein E4U41_005337, partial [Claviceps citrina]
MAPPPAPITVIESSYSDAYQEAALANYDDPPSTWHKILGETLSFNGGLFTEAELAAGPRPGSLAESELREINHQLALSGLLDRASPRPPLRRILDVGCGWGVLAQHLAAV